MPSIYEVHVNPDAENNAHAFALGMIGHNKSVLEVGCASGYLTKVLVERGCTVTGMELDPDAAEYAESWAEQVVIGDLDDPDVWAYIKDEAFDVVFFGDVLEHLRAPLAALQQAARKVKPSGFVVTSVPNVAHGDVRIALMNGRFRYGNWGLLDKTHVRFFTLETIRQLLHDAGLVLMDTKRVVTPLFRTELGVTRADVSQTTLDELHSDPEVESYQYVMKSVRDNGDNAAHEMARQISELGDRVHNQRMRIALLRKGVRDNAILQEALEKHKEYIAALEGHVSGLEHNIEVLHGSLLDAEVRQRTLAEPWTPLTCRVYRRLRRAFAK